MDNKSAFCVNQYDENIRKVIPFYDEIYEQIFDLIKAYYKDKPLSLLDTGCGTGNLGLLAQKRLRLTELVLCDPSEKMLQDARRKLEGVACRFICKGSEEIELNESFDVVTAIQSHHYFDRETRIAAVRKCFDLLKQGGLFICFENTAPFSDTGRRIVLDRVENFGIKAGRTPEEARAHSERYNREFFPITITEHLELLRETGFGSAELFWHSYMQSGFYGIKPRK